VVKQVNKTAKRLGRGIVPIAETAWTNVMTVAFVLTLMVWVGVRVTRRKTGLVPH